MTSFPTCLTEKPRALALIFRRDNTTERSLGEDIPETDRGQTPEAKKMIFANRFFEILERYATYLNQTSLFAAVRNAVILWHMVLGVVGGWADWWVGGWVRGWLGG